MLSVIEPGARGCGGLIARSRPLCRRGRHPVPILEEAGWASVPVWVVSKMLPPLGFESRLSQYLAGR